MLVGGWFKKASKQPYVIQRWSLSNLKEVSSLHMLVVLWKRHCMLNPGLFNRDYNPIFVVIVPIFCHIYMTSELFFFIGISYNLLMNKKLDFMSFSFHFTFLVLVDEVMKMQKYCVIMFVYFFLLSKARWARQKFKTETNLK